MGVFFKNYLSNKINAHKVLANPTHKCVKYPYIFQGRLCSLLLKRRADDWPFVHMIYLLSTRSTKAIPSRINVMKIKHRFFIFNTFSSSKMLKYINNLAGILPFNTEKASPEAKLLEYWLVFLSKPSGVSQQIQSSPGEVWNEAWLKDEDCKKKSDAKKRMINFHFGLPQCLSYSGKSWKTVFSVPVPCLCPNQCHIHPHPTSPHTKSLISSAIHPAGGIFYFIVKD